MIMIMLMLMFIYNTYIIIYTHSIYIHAQFVVNQSLSWF